MSTTTLHPAPVVRVVGRGAGTAKSVPRPSVIVPIRCED